MPDMTQPLWGRYENLRPAQADAILERSPIAYIPWGAIEWHSYHNPIGLDGIKAHGMLEECARHTGGVVLPPYYVGTDTIKPFKGFRHTIDHTPELVALLAREVLGQLADEGFRVIVLMTGHYGGGHVETLQKVCDVFSEEHPELRVWFFPEWQPLEGVWPPNHAAHGETSALLAFRPELVDLAALPADRVATLDDDGVWGDDPREATARDGAAMRNLLADKVSTRVMELLDETK
jgi:creatinine amidohydrolase